MHNPPSNPPPAPLPVYKAALDALPDDMRQAYQDAAMHAGIDQTDVTHTWLVAQAKLLEAGFKSHTVEVQNAVFDALRDFERQEMKFNVFLLIALILATNFVTALISSGWKDTSAATQPVAYSQRWPGTLE